MTSETSDNPFESPCDVGVAPPWRKWYCWWSLSAMLGAIALWVFWLLPWLGAILVCVAAGISVRSLLDLCRKHQAGCLITDTTQWVSCGESMMVAFAASIVGLILFFSVFFLAYLFMDEQIVLYRTEEDLRAYRMKIRVIYVVAYAITTVGLGAFIWGMGPDRLDSSPLSTLRRNRGTSRNIEGTYDDR
ncbi:hypothetical protein LOC68_26835 [Blastopirellula sp. JC732]|uniref:Uncharacterized protein n=1 Tax=Blastopirellula sediminis TaxID=2894196 RepID=A0A9X1MT53_9BACT|nr:hypothetical protein [Blastopirellula sediminis]MCC9632025.1 hypothetical protein [Blastopirellula sediminis]